MHGCLQLRGTKSVVSGAIPQDAHRQETMRNEGVRSEEFYSDEKPLDRIPHSSLLHSSFDTRPTLTASGHHTRLASAGSRHSSASRAASSMVGSCFSASR